MGSNRSLAIVAVALLAACEAPGQAAPFDAGLPDGWNEPAPEGAELPPTSHVANPFVGGDPYVNPLWTRKVLGSLAQAPSYLQRPLDVIASQPTAVWLDSIASTDTLGSHLDAAVRQQLASSDPAVPVVVSLVLYDLPDRDCAAGASNGELRLDEGGLEAYREEFIAPIIDTLQSDPLYSALRIAVVLEPDALPNAVTNMSNPACRIATPGYKQGIAHAVRELSTVSNVWTYLDIAHSGWLGWEHTERAAALYRDVLEDAGGTHLVRGFATNVSNYAPTLELRDPYDNVQANMDDIENFYQWNRMIDEQRYVDSLRGFFPDHGFLVDTGRNGWPVQSPDERRDTRAARGNWCNISSTGIGERPRPEPRPGVDAWVWVKPPGESDGAGRYDAWCAPGSVAHYDGDVLPTDALADAPPAGEWFHDHLLRMAEQATPPL